MNLPKQIHLDISQATDPTIKHADSDLYPIPQEFLKVLQERPHEQALFVAFEDLPPSVNAIYRTTARSGGIYLTKDGKKWKRYLAQVFENSVLEQRWTIPEPKKFIKMFIIYETDTWVFPDPNNMFKLLIDAAEKIVFENDKYVLTDIIDFKVESDRKKTLIMFLA